MTQQPMQFKALDDVLDFLGKDKGAQKVQGATVRVVAETGADTTEFLATIGSIAYRRSDKFAIVMITVLTGSIIGYLHSGVDGLYRLCHISGVDLVKGDSVTFKFV